MMLHLKANTNLTLPTGNLVNDLQKLSEEEKYIDQLLVEMEVPHVQVSYENLYAELDRGNGSAEEWAKALRFLRQNHTEELTVQKVKQNMRIASTSLATQAAGIANYHDVEIMLQGTEFQSLLH